MTEAAPEVGVISRSKVTSVDPPSTISDGLPISEMSMSTNWEAVDGKNGNH